MYKQNEIEVSMESVIAMYLIETDLNLLLDAGMARLVICAGMAFLIVAFV